jgi:hypothetical protein
MKSPIRPNLLELRPSGLTEVAHLGLDRPGLIPLWFGESDLVTPSSSATPPPEHGLDRIEKALSIV